MAEAMTDLAASRLDGLKYVLPGAYATAFLVLVADATNLLPFTESHFRTEWLVVGLFAAFLLGYTLHLLAIRSTRRQEQEDEDEQFFQIPAKERSRGPPRGPHDVVNVLMSNSRLFWAEVRPLVIVKFNKLTGQKITQAQLDADKKLRWFVYHFCYSYVLKAGAAEEARSNRSQFDLVRAFRTALWLGFGASLVALGGIGIRALLFRPSLLWQSPLSLTLIALGLAAPFLLGGLMREQQDRASKRLAGAVYEAFLAA